MVNTDQFSKQLLETPNLELILCKTRQCVEWVHKEQQVYRREREMTAHRPHPPIPILYTGFTSQLPSPTTPNQSLARFDKFLHVAGKSPHKGTMSIVQAWIQHPEWPTLTLTSFDNPVVDIIMNSVQRLPPNIDHFHSKLTKAEMANIQQNHGVHLCLSGMEGFGHYINEGRAVGALVVTTDYPAMNELIHEEIGVLVPPTQFIPWHNGLPYAHVSVDAISQAMKKILTKSLQERADIGARARRAFFQDEAEFAKRVKRVDCYFSTCKGIMVNDVAESRACAENACGLQFE
jgi:glycosyltransferase involved in cell wall biosynthesis